MHQQQPTITPRELSQVRQAIQQTQQSERLPSLDSIRERLVQICQLEESPEKGPLEPMAEPYVQLEQTKDELQNFIRDHGESFDEAIGVLAESIRLFKDPLTALEIATDERKGITDDEGLRFNSKLITLSEAIREHASQTLGYPEKVLAALDRENSGFQQFSHLMSSHFSQRIVAKLPPEIRSEITNLTALGASLDATAGALAIAFRDDVEAKDIAEKAAYALSVGIALRPVIALNKRPVSEELNKIVRAIRQPIEKIAKQVKQQQQSDQSRLRTTARELLHRFQTSAEGTVLRTSEALPIETPTKGRVATISSLTGKEIKEAEERLLAARFPLPRDSSVSTSYRERVRIWLETRGVAEANRDAVADNNSLDNLEAQENRLLARFHSAGLTERCLRSVIEASPTFFIVSEGERGTFAENLHSYHLTVQAGPAEIQNEFSIGRSPEKVSIERLPERIREYDITAKRVYLPEGIEWDIESELAQIDHRRVSDRIKILHSIIDEQIQHGLTEKLIKISPEILTLEEEAFLSYLDSLRDTALEVLTIPDVEISDPESSPHSYLPSNIGSVRAVIERHQLKAFVADFDSTLPEKPCSLSEAEGRFNQLLAQLGHLSSLTPTQRAELLHAHIKAHPDILFEEDPTSLAKFESKGVDRFTGYLRAVRAQLRGITYGTQHELLSRIDPMWVNPSH